MLYNKAVLLSIQPVWCSKIVLKEKTVEVRKTKPEGMKPPFKCYIYCTKERSKMGWLRIVPGRGWQRLDGTVIGEFICDDIRRIGPEYCVVKEDIESAIAGSCLTVPQVKDYAGWKSGLSYADLKDLYSWHISDLKIYDQPRELREFTGLQSTRFGMRSVKITRPPQSWRYVEDSK